VVLLFVFLFYILLIFLCCCYPSVSVTSTFWMVSHPILLYFNSPITCCSSYFTWLNIIEMIWLLFEWWLEDVWVFFSILYCYGHSLTLTRCPFLACGLVVYIVHMILPWLALLLVLDDNNTSMWMILPSSWLEIGTLHFLIVCYFYCCCLCLVHNLFLYFVCIYDSLPPSSPYFSILCLCWHLSTLSNVT